MLPALSKLASPLTSTLALKLRKSPYATTDAIIDTGQIFTSTDDTPKEHTYSTNQFSAPEVESSRTYKCGGKARQSRDIQKLVIAFMLVENRDVREAVIMTWKLSRLKFKNVNIGSAVAQLMKTFGSLIVAVTEVDQFTIPPETHAAIKDYLSIFNELENLFQMTNTDVSNDNSNDERQLKIRTLLLRLCNIIESAKTCCSSIKEKNNASYKLSLNRQKLDSVIDTSITILDIAKDASNLAPPSCVRSIVASVSFLMAAVQRTRTNYQDWQDIATTAAEFVLSVTAFMSEHNIVPSDIHVKAFTDFASALKGIVKRCINLSERSIVTRFLQHGRDSENVIQLKADLQNAIEGFQLKTHILQSFDIRELHRNINDKLDMDIIASLPEHEFFQGSRDDFYADLHIETLQQVGAWIEDPSIPVLCVFGAAGLGKSSIAHQLVYQLMDMGLLGAQTFFTRGSAIQRNPVSVIYTMSRELAFLHPRTVPAIADAVRCGSSNHQELSSYLTKYIVAPIQSLSLFQPLIIVIDALDECDNVELLLKAISAITDLSGVKILLTSRPEPRVERSLALSRNGVQKMLLQRVSQGKMEQYFSSRFSKISWGQRKPSADDVHNLVKVADGLMIWAATVCNFFENEMHAEDSYQLLSRIISTERSSDIITSEYQLSSLYRAALSHLFEGKGISGFQTVFQAMCVIQESMPVELFAETFQLSIRQTRAVHSSLASLEIYSASDSDVILPASQRFHLSFMDYIIHPDLGALSNQLHIDLTSAHSAVSSKCLARLVELTSAPGYSPPASYLDLDKSTQYVVCYWPFHLVQASIRDSAPVPNYILLRDLMGNGMDLWTPLYHLASSALSIHLEETFSAKWIDRAVNFYLHSSHLFEAAGLEQNQVFGDFGLALWRRYEQSGIMEDLKQAINMQTQHLDNNALSDFSRARAFCLLRSTLRARHITTTSLNNDLGNSINMLTKALTMHSALGQEPLSALITLAESLRLRFEKSGDIGDLNMAISMNQQESDSSTHDLHCPLALSYLSNCLISRTELYPTQNNIDKAICLLQTLLDNYPARRIITLNNLACVLHMRFEMTGVQLEEDIDKAIDMHHEVLTLRPAPHTYRSQSLINLGKCLRARFEHNGIITDIEEAKNLFFEAVELRPKSSPFHSYTLRYSALNFFARFHKTRDNLDLEQAVYLNRSSVEAYPINGGEYAEFLEGLAEVLLGRFEQGGLQGDLDEAIDLYNKALSASPSGTSTHSHSVIGLGSALLAKYRQSRSKEIFEMMERVIQGSVELCLMTLRHRVRSLNNRAQLMVYKCHKTCADQWLQDEMKICESFRLLCQSRSNIWMPVALQSLARTIYMHFQHSICATDLKRCTDLLQKLSKILPASNDTHIEIAAVIDNLISSIHEASNLGWVHVPIL